jgi:hypothetical protein
VDNLSIQSSKECLGYVGAKERRVIEGLIKAQPRKTDFQADDDLVLGGTLGGR